jgi:2-polyprenyl-6-methoxyphenol hydroxylase-like FAD-dependent oxidoreductase
VLVERRATPPFRIGESLIGAARPLLRDLGVLERFEAARHRPGLGQASAWGSDDIVRRDSFLDPRGPGWRIERVGFETMLRDTAASRGATVIAPGEILDLKRENGAGQGWIAQVGSAGRTWRLHARFLVDASGRAASFSRAAAQAQIAAQDRLICRFVHLAPRPASSDLDGFSLVEAVPDGWWYSARLPDGGTVIAFHTDADLPAARLSVTPDGFLDLLAKTRWTAVAAPGPGQANCAVGRVPARGQWLANPCGDDWCAIGDAAIAFDPLSSQGLFSALYTGFRGAEAVAAGLSGDATLLTAYRDRLARVRNAYLRNLSQYYALETRFSDHPFWARRRQTEN